MEKRKCRLCADEFRWKNCGYSHSAPEDFVKSQWQSKTRNVVYLLYRIVVAAFFIGVVAHSMTSNETAAQWGWYFIYFTHWGILFCMVTGVYGAVLVGVWHFRPDYSEQLTTAGEMPRSFKIYWCFHNTTFVCAIVITIIYWSLLYKPAETDIDVDNVLVHLTNSIVMFVDILIVSYPIRFFHFVQSLVVGLTFTVFSIVYYLLGGEDSKGNPFIYDVVDWRKIGRTSGTIVGTLMLACIVHMIVFLLYRLRVTIHARCSKSGLLASKGVGSQIGISMVHGHYGNDNPGFIGTEKVV